MNLADKPWIFTLPVLLLALLVLYRHKLASEYHAFQTRRKEWLFEKWKN